MTTLADRKAYLQSFPILASILGQKYGIRVVIGGEEAFTDGKTIHLPALPHEMSEDLFVLGNGLLDHEAAHILATDFETLNAASLSPLTHWLWNVAEDMRVERYISQRYPGCKINFEKLNTYLCRIQKPETSGSMVNNIVTWLLYAVQSRAYPSVPFPLEVCRKAIEPVFPNLLTQLGAYLDIAETCTSTATTIQWAHEVEKFLIPYFDQSVPKQDLGNSSGKEVSGENETASNSKQGENSQEEKEESAPADGDVRDGGNASPEAEVPPSASISHDSLPQTGMNQWEQSLTSGEDLPLPVGEAVKTLIEELTSTYGFYEKTEVAEVKVREEIGELPACELAKASSAIRALSIRLSGLLQTQTLNRVALGRSGKVDCSRLYRLQTGNSKVFRRDTEKQDINTAIHILLDSSDSMEDGMQLACAACYAVAASVSAIRGVNVAVTAFYGDYLGGQGKFISHVTPILRHRERMHRKFFINANGTTPMSEALWWVFQEGVLLKEKRKIILVLSDGAPNSLSDTQHALQIGQKLGFEIYGVGIGKNAAYMPKLIPESQLIHSIDDLAPAMIHILQKAMVVESAGVSKK